MRENKKYKTSSKNDKELFFPIFKKKKILFNIIYIQIKKKKMN
jgi:hypothetical protein